jgi:hypothetical protein
VPRILAVAAAVLVVVAGVSVAMRGGDDTTDVATEPSTSSTTTSTVVTTTTLPPPTTVVTTTTVAPTTATTVPTTTTSTTVAAEEPLTITCATTNDPQPTVTCEWSGSTRPGVNHYRLWKHTGDGPDQEVYAGPDTRAVDTAVLVGARLFYEVTALADDGAVLGHGVTMITCC